MQGACPARAGNVPLPFDRSLPRAASYEEGVAVLKSAAPFEVETGKIDKKALRRQYWPDRQRQIN
jgi:hypothetical protein